ncbi:MAG: hypothetical protein MJ188_04675 [Treponema sp.]|nr:hypothetical protein [Treponema sp.]
MTEDLNTGTEVDYYFSVEDFCNGYFPDELFKIFPDSIKADYQSVYNENNYVSILNEILLRKDVIEKCSANLNIELEDEVRGIIDIIDTLSEDQLVSLNRLFIFEVYKDVCPPVNYGCNDIVQVFPLYYINIDKNTDMLDNVTDISEDDNQYEMSRYVADLKGFAEIGIGEKTNDEWIRELSEQTEDIYKINFDNYQQYKYEIESFEKDFSSCKRIEISFNATTDNYLFAGFTNITGFEFYAGVDCEFRLEKWFKIWKKDIVFKCKSSNCGEKYI